MLKMRPGAVLPVRTFGVLLIATLAACASDHPDLELTAAASDTAPIHGAPPEHPEPGLPTPTAAAPVTPLTPNELGEIMVLEYHRLGEPEGEFRRSVENFRADLSRLYEAGYRPITVRQMVEGDIAVPLGATPVVFTIDDSSTGQFYYLEDGTIDPNSMVGMWDAFRRDHPDWENGATWCVLPGADHPSNFFGERPSREVARAEREETIRRKVEHLIATGHEICNHTLFHARLDRASGAERVQEWIGRGEDSIKVYLPEGYGIVTLALPLGMWPEERSLAWRGRYEGREYRYDAVLLVTGGPNPSPFHQDFDPLAIKRVIVAPGHLERYLAGYDQHPDRRFVSDGDPRAITVPEGAVEQVARERWPKHEIRISSPPTR